MITSGVPRWELRYKTNKNKFAFRVGLLRLAEVNDTTGAFESKNVLRFQTIKKESWSKMKDGWTTEKNGNGSTVHTVKSTLKYNNHAKFGDLEISIVATFADDVLVNKDNITLTPSSVKFSLYINVSLRM